MYKTSKDLAIELNCRGQLINQYLCRSEFSHIKRIRKKNIFFYEDISNEDKIKLKYYIESAKERSGHHEIRRRNKTKN